MLQYTSIREILNSTPNYSYSKRLLDFIKEEIKKDPENIIQGLRDSLKNKLTLGAWDF